jgi:hypothetical protein
MDFMNGRDIEFGDRLVFNLKNTFKQEVVVMNIQPQLGGGGEVLLYLFECASAMDKDVQEILGWT